MRYRLGGLVHVRHLGAALVMVIPLLIATWYFYDIVAMVQVDVHQLARFVGAPELFGAVVAALAPAVCVPAFDARERMAVNSARRLHTLVSAGIVLAPLLVLFMWYAAIRVEAPLQVLPPLHDFAGNFVLMGCVGLGSKLAFGTRWGPPATLAACYGLLGLQQLWPASLLATAFSTATRWNTNWSVAAAVYGTTVALDYMLSSVPRHSARHS